ncbi:MAG: ribosome biogenesis GTPase Der [Actinomycetota bacterium]
MSEQQTAASPGRIRMPVVAVVGRPNVGKSSLVNRVIGRREAIVEASPGVTRDRRAFTARWRDKTFEVVDTGGLEPGAAGLEERVAEQAHVAMASADVVLFVVDATTGPQQDDMEVAELLRRSTKRVLLVANKVDDAQVEAEVPAFYRLGLGEPVPVSALHGRGSGDLLDRVVALLPDVEPGPDEQWASVAIVGRPNVGKSSLLNALAGEERSIVDPVPHTTRDPTDSTVELPDGRDLRIVDTAGLRRHTHVKDPLEYYSSLRTRGTIGRVNAVLLVIDASEGVTGLDQRLAEDVIDAGRACVVVLNKWDLVTEEEVKRVVERGIEQRLGFLSWAPRLRVSALTGRSIDKILPLLARAIEAHRLRLPTALVNDTILSAQERRPHPRTGGRALRIRYAVQAEAEPPLFLLFSSGRLRPEYLRYVENRLREVEPFTGSPVRVETRTKGRR